MGKIQSNLV